MPFFKDRQDAGEQLALLLAKYKGQDVVVYAIPRGGLAVAVEIAKFLNAPLSLILAHKIGHPYQPEYALAAISESGHVVGSSHELALVDQEWLEQQKQRQITEIKRRRESYCKGQKPIVPSNKIAIIVDDGVATGLTMQAGILELRGYAPQKIIAAVPVAPRSTLELLKTMADDAVAVQSPEDYEFLGAVGAYYHDFGQVEDETAMEILWQHADFLEKVKSHHAGD